MENSLTGLQRVEENPALENLGEAIQVETDRIDVAEEEDEIYGAKISKKDDGVLRIGYSNINGIPAFNDNPKNKNIFNAIQRAELDIVGFSEVNRHWPCLPVNQHWRERTKTWWESRKLADTYNKNDSQVVQYQPGGCMLMSLGKASHRCKTVEKDPTGLGRWVCCTYGGKRNMNVSVIVAYRPCKSHGLNTAYSQHQRYLQIMNRDRCPREVILEDLSTVILQKHEQNHQVILMMDLNEDVQNANIRTWCASVGLRNGITDSQNERQPATFHRGVLPIDGIFVSHSVQVSKGGFLPFGFIPSDHRGLWIEVSMDSAFGFSTPKLVYPSARALNTSLPKVRKEWTKLYTEFIQRHKLNEKLFTLEMECNGQPLNENQIVRYEKIMKLRHEGLIYAEKRCRKIRAGGVQYSEEVGIARLAIELWEATVTKLKGCKYSLSKIKRLQHKTKQYRTLTVGLEVAEKKVEEAKSHYYSLKKDHRKLRRTFMEQKAKDLAEEKDQCEKNVYQQLLQQEQQRDSSRKVKYVLNKFKAGAIHKVEVERNGQKELITDKEEMEKVCIEENDRKYNQTRNTPCLQHPLRQLLGNYSNTPFADSILDGSYSLPFNMSPYVSELFDQLKKPDHIELNEVATSLTVETFRQGWGKMKERTSAGISGLHFGQMKTCALNTFLANFESSLAHIPFNTGYSPRLWRVGV